VHISREEGGKKREERKISGEERREKREREGREESEWRSAITPRNDSVCLAGTVVMSGISWDSR
jgi:hypothetical protein